MPCTFSGVFFVESIGSDFRVACHFKDVEGMILPLVMTHYQPRSDNDSHPFPEAFQRLEEQSIYIISGTFAIRNLNEILVSSSDLFSN